MSRSCRVPKKRVEIEEPDEPEQKQTVVTYHRYPIKSYEGMQETMALAKEHITKNPYLYAPWRVCHETTIDPDQRQQPAT